MTNIYTCAYCAQKLEAATIKIEQGIALPCHNCGKLNLFPNIFKVVEIYP